MYKDVKRSQETSKINHNQQAEIKRRFLAVMAFARAIRQGSRVDWHADGRWTDAPALSNQSQAGGGFSKSNVSQHSTGMRDESSVLTVLERT